MAESQAKVYRTALEGIKAPLGVLLYLIRRDNLDIYDIPISRITKEYLEYLDLMEELHIELAGEFFVLAATLMRIKAQMLLRKDESEEDPREGLVRSLLEGLGRPWSWFAVTRLLPLGLRDRAYALVARNRFRWFGRHDVCFAPTPDIKDRFLE